jgi:UTP--glucose-1-phosphate uridylyltransferase
MAEDIISRCSFTFCYQKDPLGESDAISIVRDIVGKHPMATIYPDNIYLPAPGALKTLIPAFKKYKTDVTALMEVNRMNIAGISNSGRVDIKHIGDGVFQIKRLHPKERGAFMERFNNELRTCGMSVAGPHYFQYIKRARDTVKEGELTDTPVNTMILNEKGLIGCRLQGNVFDIGNPKGYDLCLANIKDHSPLAP